MTRAVRSPRGALSFVTLAVAVLVPGACYDPVHLDAVAQQGDEAPNVPPGPNHRPGQPCLVCHGGDGPAALELAVAGTVFKFRQTSETPPPPLPNAIVTITDGSSVTRQLRTNEAGNFYVSRRDWDVAFPLSQIKVEQGKAVRVMTTKVGRDGSCNFCHSRQGDDLHMPVIYLEGQ